MYTRRLEQRQRQEATLHPEPLALPGASKGTTAASLSGTSCQGGAATSCWTPRNCGAQGVGSPSHQGTACARVQCAGATAGRGCNQGTACARVQCARVMAQALLQSTPLFSRHLRRQHAVRNPPTSSSTELGASRCCRARRADATEHAVLGRMELARRCYRALRRDGSQRNRVGT